MLYVAGALFITAPEVEGPACVPAYQTHTCLTSGPSVFTRILEAPCFSFLDFFHFLQQGSQTQAVAALTRNLNISEVEASSVGI